MVVGSHPGLFSDYLVYPVKFSTRLTHRFDEALTFATHLHAGQVRKVSGGPYVAHLLSVAALVLEDHGSEEEAIAALLHDAIEDQGGEKLVRKSSPVLVRA
jgi:(p)ppGpp synthase/HD superfamily hydrolase